jgi:hypothetical protein
MKQLLLLPKTNGPSSPLAKIEVAVDFPTTGIGFYQAVVRPRFPRHFVGDVFPERVPIIAVSPHFRSERDGLNTPYPMRGFLVKIPAIL